MNQANNLAQVDVLAVLDGDIEGMEAVLPQARGKQRNDLIAGLEQMREARAAVAELVATLRSSRDVIATALRGAAPDFFKTDCDIAEHVQIKRIDAALRPFTGERA